jgi:RNA polymerase sigma-70 factor, ECF subfamily
VLAFAVVEQLAEGTPSLLARVAAGERAAMRECLARHSGLVWTIARRFEPGDAEDAVQEIFLDLWKSAARFDAAVASESVFVAMIARRRLIDRRRTRTRRPVTEAFGDEPALAAPGSGPDTCAEAAQAARALDQLRPDQRRVLVLATCHGMSHSEIAEAIGIPLGTVKAHARRGLLAIRAALLGVPAEQVGEELGRP